MKKSKRKAKRKAKPKASVKSRQFNLLLTEPQREALDKRAYRDGCTAADIVRALICRELKP